MRLCELVPQQPRRKGTLHALIRAVCYACFPAVSLKLNVNAISHYTAHTQLVSNTVVIQEMSVMTEWNVLESKSVCTFTCFKLF